MTDMRMPRFALCRVVPAVLFLGLVLFASVAHASHVSVDIPYDAGNTTLAGARNEALEKGFAVAVRDNALGLLPSQPSETVVAALDEFLADKAGKFVLNYSDIQTASSPGTYSLSMDVSVNRRELRRYLKEIGLFHALSGATVPLALNVAGASDEDLLDISALRILGGFVLQPGAAQFIDIGRKDKATWQGTMRTASEQWTAEASSPDAVWHTLVSRYFGSVEDEGLSMAGADRLLVEGWYAPEGVQEFDALLRSWDDALADVTLARVELRPAGVSAVWRLKVLHPGVLEERLESHLSGRGLTHTLEGGGQQGSWREEAMSHHRQSFGKNNLTVPNLLTILRILLTPGFMVAFINQRIVMAWILFAVAGLTDALDGFLARVLNQRTTLGAILDPLADKMLLVTSFVSLAVVGWVQPWVAALVVTRDVIIVGGLALLQFMGVDVRSSIRPSITSKATTALQILLVFFIMLERSFAWDMPTLKAALTWAAAGATVVSGAQYVARGFALFPSGDEQFADQTKRAARRADGGRSARRRDRALNSGRVPDLGD